VVQTKGDRSGPPLRPLDDGSKVTATESAAETRRHAAVVYNPIKARLDPIRSAVIDQERANGWDRTRWYETSSADSGRSAAAQALGEQPAVVVVVGGDGTVRAIAEVMHGTGIPVALLPAGTGNLLARELSTPLNDVAACIAAAFTGDDRGIDVGTADLEDETGTRSTHAFVVMAGIGLDADMAQHTSAIAKKHLGWLAYVTSIARSIIRNRLFHLNYRIDDERVSSTRAHTVIVGNCGTLTGNLLLLPAAVIDDGLLDVVMMRPEGAFGWARIGTRLTLQGIARQSRVTGSMMRRTPDLLSLAYVQGRQFEARFDTPHVIELDGDSFGHVTRVRMSLHPGALLVRVAPQAFRRRE